MTWSGVSDTYAASYAAVSPSVVTYTATGQSTVTYQSPSAAATVYTSTETHSNATVVAFDPSRATAGRPVPVYPVAGFDIGVNFVYRVKTPEDWTVRTDRPLPIVSTITDSP